VHARTRAIVVVAKSPRSGQVKTRLCPPLSPLDAAGLHHAFLRDTTARVCGLADVQVVFAYAPPEDRELFAEMSGDALLAAQSDGDLGERLRAIFESLSAHGFRRIVAIGADTPTLPREFFHRAFALLDRPDVDMVLGPAEDGGYYLIGLRIPRPEVFQGIPWSTDRVFAETKRRAEAAGLRVASPPPWWDVDTFADLTRLAETLRTDVTIAHHTRSVLTELRLL